MTSGPRSLRAYVAAIRPHQWMKNLLVFLPMLAAQQLTAVAFLDSLLAFAVFCLAASGACVRDDLLDLAADRADPRRRHRPLASGSIPIADGTGMGMALLLGSLALGWAFALVVFAYQVMAAAYSVDLKRRPLIDIAVLAGLTAMRPLAGAVATGLPLSGQLLAATLPCSSPSPPWRSIGSAAWS